MEQSIKAVENQLPPSAETLPAILPSQAPTTFTKVDNNLTGIGFFTASSKRSRKAIEKTTVVMDQGVAHHISILPSAKYGLPITQDQDYWLALMQLVEERRRQEGRLKNPFTFTTADIRHILGQVNSGKNYKAVNEWLSVMNATAIEGGTYNAVRKSWYTEKTHAIDRVITVGKQLPDGSIADRNYIWFSQWQLDNINAGNLIAIELTTYIQLENNISKNLVPHLQEWLFASQRDGRFEKQYNDICQLLGIRVYHYRSDVERQLAPSLDELKAHGYLSKWAVEPMADRKHYKLVLSHGSKYHSDRQVRLEKKAKRELPSGETTHQRKKSDPQRVLFQVPQPEEFQTARIIDYRSVAELTKRGVEEIAARAIIAHLPPDYPLLDILEYGDQRIAANPRKWDNPAGFYVKLIQQRSKPPQAFETTRAKKAREEAEIARAQAILQDQEECHLAEEAETAAIDSQIEALEEADRLTLLSQAKAAMIAQHPRGQDFMASYLDSHPDSFTKDGSVWVKARRMMREGWTPPKTTPQPQEPHYATKTPIRQATALQETAPVQPVVKPLQPADARPRFYSTASIAAAMNLEAILTTPQLMAPKQEQPAVELLLTVEPPAKSSIDDHLL